jgi:hypothetical protein
MAAGMAITQVGDKPDSCSKAIMCAGKAEVTDMVSTMNSAKQPKRRVAQVFAHRGRLRVGDAPCEVVSVWLERRALQQPCVQRRTNQELQRRQRPQGLAPAPQIHPPGKQRNEHRAGQSAQKRERDDGAAKVLRKAARDHANAGV